MLFFEYPMYLSCQPVDDTAINYNFYLQYTLILVWWDNAVSLGTWGLILVKGGDFCFTNRSRLPLAHSDSYPMGTGSTSTSI